MKKYLSQLSYLLNKLNAGDLIAFILCLINFIIWGFLLTYKYYNFGFSDWDFALYAQTMWNVCHGSIYVSLFGTSFLANHANYIAFVLAPIYLIFAHPLILIYLKIFSLTAGAFIFYLIAAKKTSKLIAITLLILYLFHPPNIYMLLFEFDFESLAIGLLFLMYYFFINNKFVPFLITAFLACLCKENIPFIVMTFGVYAFFVKKGERLKWGGTTFLLGLLIFSISIFIIMPMLREQMTTKGSIYLSSYLNVFNHGSSIGERVAFVLKLISDKTNQTYIINLFGPLLALAFLSPHILFLGSPILFQNLLAAPMSQHTIFYHYAATIVPFIFLASLESISFWKKRFKYKIFLPIIISAIIISSLVRVFNYTADWKAKISRWNDRLNPIRWAMIDQIPKNASIITNFNLLSQLSQRKNLYALYNVWIDLNGFTGEKKFIVPNHVDHALVDFGDPWMIGGMDANPQKTSQKLKELFIDHDWRVQQAVEEMVFLTKNTTTGIKLLEIQPQPFPKTPNENDISVDQTFDLQAVTINHNLSSNGQLLPITFYWKANEEIKNQYALNLGIRKNNDWVYTHSRTIGYTIYPTSVWKKGDYIKEYYAYYLPVLEPGEYSIDISIMNRTAKQPANLTLNRTGKESGGKTISIATFTISP